MAAQRVVIESQVASGVDDCFAQYNAARSYRYNNGAGYWEAGQGMTDQFMTSAARFTGITIPPGAIVDTAYFIGSVWGGSNTHRSRTQIRGEDSQSPSPYEGLTENFADRLYTQAKVDWDVDDEWWEIYAVKVSPSLVPIIQELVGKYTYNNGVIAILFDDDGSDVLSILDFQSYDRSPTEAPILHIEYIIEVEPTAYTLTIQTRGQGTTDPAPGSWEYPEGSQVTVTAIPAAGWQFSHWEGDISSTDKTITFIITSDMAITAVFVQIPTHVLTIETVGQGTTSPAPGAWEYEDGALVRVSAIPAAGWMFDHWEGDISSLENPAEFIITSDMTIVAVFSEAVVPPEEHAVSISVIGKGTTAPEPGTYAVEHGAILTITAYPDAGWLFDHWEGDISGTMNTIDIEVLEDISVVAVFVEAPAPPPKPRWVWPVVAATGAVGVIIAVIAIARGKGRKR